MEDLINTLEWLHINSPERFEFIKEYIEGAAEMSKAKSRDDSSRLILLDKSLTETLKKEHGSSLKRIEDVSLETENMEQSIFILSLLERHLRFVLWPKYLK